VHFRGGFCGRTPMTVLKLRRACHFELALQELNSFRRFLPPLEILALFFNHYARTLRTQNHTSHSEGIRNYE